MDSNKKNSDKASEEKLSRKAALKKAGKYAAFTAASMFIILSPAKAQSTSPSNPGGGWPPS